MVPATLDARFLADLPARLSGDGGYDSDALDETLMNTYGIEMIAANRLGRARTQDGRPSAEPADGAQPMILSRCPSSPGFSYPAVF